MEELHINKMLM